MVTSWLPGCFNGLALVSLFAGWLASLHDWLPLSAPSAYLLSAHPYKVMRPRNKQRADTSLAPKKDRVLRLHGAYSKSCDMIVSLFSSLSSNARYLLFSKTTICVKSNTQLLLVVKVSLLFIHAAFNSSWRCGSNSKGLLRA